MKPGRVFWGVFLIVFGIVLMLDRFTNVQLHIALSWKLWPLFIVLWGLGLVIGTKAARIVVAALIGAFLALFMLSSWWGNWGEDREYDRSGGSDQVFHETYDPSIHHASFVLETGAGTFTLRDTSAELMTADAKSGFGTYRVERIHSDALETVNLRHQGPMKNWGMGRSQNSVDVRLHPGPAWDMRFGVGAARLSLDLSAFVVTSLEINAGATDGTLKLGSRSDETRVSVSTGASSVKILVPSSSGCDIRATAPLSWKDFRGFEKLESGHYQTEQFSSASKRIFIDINAGVSSLRIVRY